MLLGEHDPESEQRIRRFLEGQGIEVEAVHDGQAAMEAALVGIRQRNPFDLVIVDSQLPVIEGTQVARRLRDQGFRGPIVAVVSSASSTDRSRYVAAGCNDCFAKPVQDRDLTACVRKHLGKSGPPKS